MINLELGVILQMQVSNGNIATYQSAVSLYKVHNFDKKRFKKAVINSFKET